MSKKDNSSLGLICSRCQRPNADTLCKCGICVYHIECASVTKACNCGFPMTTLLTFGQRCMACNRNKTDKLLCCDCFESFLGMLKGISKKGLSLDSSSNTSCHVFMSSTSMLHPNISDPSATIVCNRVIRSAVKHADFLCIYNNTVHRVEDAMTQYLFNTKTPIQISKLANCVGCLSVETALDRFKTLHWESKNGISINLEGMASIINSSKDIVNKSSLLQSLERGPPFSPLRPILESWFGAAHVIREKHKKGQIIIMDDKYIMYTKTPTHPDMAKKQKWQQFVEQ